MRAVNSDSRFYKTGAFQCLLDIGVAGFQNKATVQDIYASCLVRLRSLGNWPEIWGSVLRSPVVYGAEPQPQKHLNNIRTKSWNPVYILTLSLRRRFKDFKGFYYRPKAATQLSIMSSAKINLPPPHPNLHEIAHRVFTNPMVLRIRIGARPTCVFRVQCYSMKSLVKILHTMAQMHLRMRCCRRRLLCVWRPLLSSVDDFRVQ